MLRNRLEGAARSRGGFTIVELVVVLIVFGILVGIAVPQMGKYMRSRALTNARDALVLSGARARALAVERGDIIRWIADEAGDSVVIVVTGGDTVDVIDFNEEPAVDLSIAFGDVEICFTARGFVQPSCEDGGSLPIAVALTRGGDTARAEITAVGRIDRK